MSVRIVPNPSGIAQLHIIAENWAWGKYREVEAAAVALAPFRTGALKASINLSGTGKRGIISATVPYAAFVELGTKAHMIFPVEKKALWWEGAHHPHHRVHHPGARAQSYLGAAVDAVRAASG